MITKCHQLKKILNNAASNAFGLTFINKYLLYLYILSLRVVVIVICVERTNM